VLVVWGFTEAGERVLLAVMLGMRESYEDWLVLGRDLIGRGLLGTPMLIVADGRPRPDRGDRAAAGPPRTASAAVCTGRATSTPSCPSASANGSRRRTGRRSMTPSARATPSSDSTPSSTSSTSRATQPPPDASPTTSTP